MKNRFLNFLRKYWFGIFLSVIMFLVFVIPDVFNISISGGSKVEHILLYFKFMLIYSFIYGCLSYLNIKKIWVPPLITFLITCTYYSISYLIYLIYLINSHLIIYRSLEAWKNILYFAACMATITLVGTLVTAFIYHLIKWINRLIKSKKKI